MRAKMEEVFVKVTEAVTRWMTVWSRTEIHAGWEEWFKKVTKHAEGKDSKRKRERNKFKLSQKIQKNRMAAQTDETKTLDWRFAGIKDLSNDSCPLEKHEK